MVYEDINIRSFQHYLYCPHRWGLIEIEKCWAENYYVTKANLLHSRVHEAQTYSQRGRRIFTSIPVFHDDLGLYGVLDSLEAREDEKGVAIGKEGKRYALSIVEHKPTKPKKGEYNYPDLMQVYAQKLCVDFVFHTDVKAFIYYADVKNRIELPMEEMKESLHSDFLRILYEMRELLKLGLVPKKPDSQQCSACSLKSLCLPKRPRSYSLHKEIEKMLSQE